MVCPQKQSAQCASFYATAQAARRSKRPANARHKKLWAWYKLSPRRACKRRKPSNRKTTRCCGASKLKISAPPKRGLKSGCKRRCKARPDCSSGTATERAPLKIKRCNAMRCARLFRRRRCCGARKTANATLTLNAASSSACIPTPIFPASSRAWIRKRKPIFTEPGSPFPPAKARISISSFSRWRRASVFWMRFKVIINAFRSSFRRSRMLIRDWRVFAAPAAVTFRSAFSMRAAKRNPISSRRWAARGAPGIGATRLSRQPAIGSGDRNLGIFRKPPPKPRPSKRKVAKVISICSTSKNFTASARKCIGATICAAMFRWRFTSSISAPKSCSRKTIGCASLILTIPPPKTRRRRASKTG